MRKFRLLQQGASLALGCIMFCGCVLFAGCGKSDPPPKSSAYAELDARFPGGQPLATGAQERAKDAEYLEKVSAAAKEMSDVQRVAEAAKRETENFRAQVVQAMTEKLGKAPTEAMVEEQLAKKAYYQQLLAAQREAEAAVEAKRLANQELIRQRMWAEAEAYKAMKAEADAKALAAGEAVRGASPVASAQTAQRVAAQPQAAPAREVAPATKPVSLETLSHETGLPVLPSDK